MITGGSNGHINHQQTDTESCSKFSIGLFNRRRYILKHRHFHRTIDEDNLSREKASSIALDRTTDIKSKLLHHSVCGSFTESCNTIDRYQVFLGGSCSPTTWRRDIAIPHLIKMNISFYNPQVINWHPGLIGLEEEAKHNARVCLFAFEPVTRSIASLVEVVYLATIGRQIVVSMQAPSDTWNLNDEVISDSELSELKLARDFVLEVLERNNVPTYLCVTSALKCVEQIIHQNIITPSIILNKKFQATKLYLPLPIRLQHLKKLYNIHYCKRRDNKRYCKNLHLLCKDLSEMLRLNIQVENFVQKMIQVENSMHRESSGLKHDAIKLSSIDFELFCIIIAECISLSLSKLSLRVQSTPISWSTKYNHKTCGRILVQFCQIIHKKLLPANYKSLMTSYTKSSCADMCCHTDHQKSHGIETNYLVGVDSLESVDYWKLINFKSLMFRMELASVKQIISQLDEARSACNDISSTFTGRIVVCVGSKARASHLLCFSAYLIATKVPIIVYIKDLTPELVIDSKQLSSFAVKDYNRGRAYLRDLLVRERQSSLCQSVDEILQRLAQKH